MRDVHDQLCRALLRFPTTSAAGFAPMADIARRDGTNLRPLFEIALQCLREKAVYLADGGELSGSFQQPCFESKYVIARPSFTIIATQYAAQHEPNLLESDVLPLISRAEGEVAAEDSRRYAQLFLASNTGYREAAERWFQMCSDHQGLYPGISTEGGRLAEVQRIWKARALTCDLSALIAKWKKP